MNNLPNLSSLALSLNQGRLRILDQQALPDRELWLDVPSPQVMIDAIKALKVRGAPLIGVAAALSLGLYAQEDYGVELVQRVALSLREARPTAVNLMWAIDRLLQFSPEQMLAEAYQIFEEDVALCTRMGQLGSELIEEGDQILTHCNSGGLATAGIGTALGVLQTAWEAGKNIHVYVDETRPLLQGARLTSWELQRLGIPHTLICDNMAAFLMQQGKINKVFLGADRVASNGDFANKIGTYSVAVNATYHQIPFYPVAPHSTIDLQCPSGSHIPIETRDAQEVRGVIRPGETMRWSPPEVTVYNPSFDVTPVELVTALITNKGIFDRAALQAGALKEV